MAYGIIVETATMATNVDSLVRSVKSASDIENGSVFQLASRSTAAGEGDVWVATAPAASAGLQHLWMAAEPEVVQTASGSNYYKGLDPDVRNFKNIAGDVFTAFKPQIGDLIQLSSDAIEGSKSDYVVATATKLKLQWAAAAVSGLSLKLLGQEDISIGSGTLGATHRQTAYLFEVVAIA